MSIKLQRSFVNRLLRVKIWLKLNFLLNIHGPRAIKD
jgi:hypothetical protein